MAKSKLLQEIEDMKAFSDALKAENSALKAAEEYSKQKWNRADAEISRCHKLLDMVPFAPTDPDATEYTHGDLSVRLMGTLLAAGKCRCEFVKKEDKGE